MVQLSNLFNTLSKNTSSRTVKKSRLGIGEVAANALVKEAKRNELLLTSSGAVNAKNNESFSVGYSKRGKKGLNQDCFIMWEVRKSLCKLICTKSFALLSWMKGSLVLA